MCGYGLTNSTTWKDANVIAGGDCTGGSHREVIVRWSDGETTLCTDTSTTLGREHMLVPPKAG
ncbi:MULTISPECIES: hypothetical protein [unclassified Streptomyces]|uniref:hypothetical protein n=1 Tax=unclassified Streptomyces TaxID=2593676 RepID=UPI001F049596|nr:MULTISPECIES: hypothetical protein [unclassified Streptomyces]MCH0562097.1 hypothetical protein [Streptomyces sp. MUM 2J]MCH0568102.1 hypothetical protein [Streptomyces sp. MUM 136J]